MTKHFIVLFSFLTLLSFNARAIEIDRHMSGSWYNPDQDGHGLSVEVLVDERAVFYWYVFNPDGTPTFLIAIGDVEGDSIVASAYHVTGMKWGIFNPAEKVQTVWGDITLKFHDCNSATLTYGAGHGLTNIPHGSGVISLVRLANVGSLQCNDNPYSGIYEGVMERSSSGVYHRAKVLLAADYSFAMFAEDMYMVFGDYEVDQVSGNLYSVGSPMVFPLDSKPDPFKLVDGFGAEVTVGNRLLPLVVIPDIGFDRWDLVSLDLAFRRGVEFNGPIKIESIEKEYKLQDLISGKRADTKIGQNGEFITTSSENECNWDGTVLIPDPQFNLLEVTFKVTECGDLNGQYTGLGYNADGGHNYTWSRVVYIYARSDDDDTPMVLLLTPSS